jgi:glycerol-3-phosphate dehydrogenase subunit C
MVCPTGVKIAEINARARAIMVEQGKVSLPKRLRNNMLARAELLGKVAWRVAPVANYLINLKIARGLAEKTLGIHRDAPFPPFSKQRFTDWFHHHQRQHSGDLERQVVYFHGCSTQYYEPRVGIAAVQVLETNGFEVIVPPQNCCGLPLLSNGEFTAARRYHETNVAHLALYARQGIPIVGTSTSCTLTLKEEAPELLDMDDRDTRLVAQHVYDLNEFLWMIYQEGALRIPTIPIPETLAYHIPCQYRAHRIGKPGLDVLGLIPDLVLVDSQADCCGIAGTYGYKQEKYNISMQVGSPLFSFINKLQSPAVVCESETCRWQISHATGIPAFHPVELLALSYGFQPDSVLSKVIHT